MTLTFWPSHFLPLSGAETKSRALCLLGKYSLKWAICFAPGRIFPFLTRSFPHLYLLATVKWASLFLHILGMIFVLSEAHNNTAKWPWDAIPETMNQCKVFLLLLFFFSPSKEGHIKEDEIWNQGQRTTIEPQDWSIDSLADRVPTLESEVDALCPTVIEWMSEAG